MKKQRIEEVKGSIDVREEIHGVATADQTGSTATISNLE